MSKKACFLIQENKKITQGNTECKKWNQGLNPGFPAQDSLIVTSLPSSPAWIYVGGLVPVALHNASIQFRDGFYLQQPLLLPSTVRETCGSNNLVCKYYYYYSTLVLSLPIG